MSDTITPAEYWDLCAQADWTFEFSDDHSVWKRGTAEREKLCQLATLHPELTSIFEAFERKYLTDPLNRVPADERTDVPPRPADGRLCGQLEFEL